MITEIRRRRAVRRQRTQLERVLVRADHTVRNELIAIAQRQGII